jgi:hypothetical protein
VIPCRRSGNPVALQGFSISQMHSQEMFRKDLQGMCSLVGFICKGWNYPKLLIFIEKFFSESILAKKISIIVLIYTLP